MVFVCSAGIRIFKLDDIQRQTGRASYLKHIDPEKMIFANKSLYKEKERWL
jgi:hypothetical protein